MLPSTLRFFRLGIGTSCTKRLWEIPSRNSCQSLHTSIVIARAPPLSSWQNGIWKTNSAGRLVFSSFHRTLKTTAPRSAIPPVFLLVASKLGKLVAVFLGRHFRVWYTKLPAETKTEYHATAKRHRGIIYSKPFHIFV